MKTCFMLQHITVVNISYTLDTFCVHLLSAYLHLQCVTLVNPHIVRSCFFIHSDNLCLSIQMFSILRFNVTIDILGLYVAFYYSCLSLCFCSSFLSSLDYLNEWGFFRIPVMS